MQPQAESLAKFPRATCVAPSPLLSRELLLHVSHTHFQNPLFFPIVSRSELAYLGTLPLFGIESHRAQDRQSIHAHCSQTEPTTPLSGDLIRIDETTRSRIEGATTVPVARGMHHAGVVPVLACAWCCFLRCSVTLFLALLFIRGWFIRGWLGGFLCLVLLHLLLEPERSRRLESFPRSKLRYPGVYLH